MRADRRPVLRDCVPPPHALTCRFMAEIRVVLFDIDGTLIRSGGAGVKAFERTSATVFGIPDGTAHLQFAGRTDTGLVSHFLRHHGLPESDENQHRFLHAYTHLLGELLPNCPGAACPGVRQWLDALRHRPSPPLIGLLTGNIRLGAELKLRHYGLWDVFALGAFGCDHSNRNELARIALERCSKHLGEPLSGRNLLIIGDTPLDVECARSINAVSLAVATGGSSLEELRACNPDWLAPSLEDLAPELVLGEGAPPALPRNRRAAPAKRKQTSPRP